jgi:hypothetical protein
VFVALRSSIGSDLSQAIGLAFFFAFTAAAAFNALAFAQTVSHSLGPAAGLSSIHSFDPAAAAGLSGIHALGTDADAYQTTSWIPALSGDQVLGSAALALFTLLCYHDVRLSGRLSLLILTALLISLTASLACIACPIARSLDDNLGRHTVLKRHAAAFGATLADNVEPQLSSPRGGVLSFALLFPGFTGVLAGALCS